MKCIVSANIKLVIQFFTTRGEQCLLCFLLFNRNLEIQNFLCQCLVCQVSETQLFFRVTFILFSNVGMFVIANVLCTSCHSKKSFATAAVCIFSSRITWVETATFSTMLTIEMFLSATQIFYFTTAWRQWWWNITIALVTLEEPPPTGCKKKIDLFHTDWRWRQ